MKSIKFLATDGKIIHYSVETDSYKVVNSKKPYYITKVEFKTLDTRMLSREKYAQKMNDFFNNIGKVEWDFNGQIYRKLDNFDYNGDDMFNANYKLGTDVPYHYISHHGNCVLVYHWGKIYYCVPSYNGYPNGYLIDVKTHLFVRWCRLKNTSPVFNTNLKQIV